MKYSTHAVYNNVLEHDINFEYVYHMYVQYILYMYND